MSAKYITSQVRLDDKQSKDVTVQVLWEHLRPDTLFWHNFFFKKEKGGSWAVYNNSEGMGQGGDPYMVRRATPRETYLLETIEIVKESN